MSSLSVLCLQCTRSKGGGNKEAVGFNILRCILRSKCFGINCECESNAWPGDDVADKNRGQVFKQVCICENLQGAKKKNSSHLFQQVCCLFTLDCNEI